MFFAVTVRVEALPLIAWMAWRPSRVWAWAGALAWSAILLFVPFWRVIGDPVPSQPLPAMEAVGAGGEGLVYLSPFHQTEAGNWAPCNWGRYPWETHHPDRGADPPAGRAVPGDQSGPRSFLLTAGFDVFGPRPHWESEWQAAGLPDWSSWAQATPGRAGALGARWLVSCDPGGDARAVDRPGTPPATGAVLQAHPSEQEWHRAAVRWWLTLDDPPAGDRPWVIPAHLEEGVGARPLGQAARGVRLEAAEDTLTVVAEQPGWAWLRVPWDPWWASGDTPVLKGGPGHLVVWGATRGRGPAMGGARCRRRGGVDGDQRRRAQRGLYGGREPPPELGDTTGPAEHRGRRARDLRRDGGRLVARRDRQRAPRAQTISLTHQESPRIRV